MIDPIDPDKVRELAKLHRKWGEEGAWEPKTESSHTQIAVVLESLLPNSSQPMLGDSLGKGQNPWSQSNSYFTVDSSLGPILGVFQNRTAAIDAVISIRSARLFDIMDTVDEDLTITEWNGTQVFSSLSWEEVDQACLDRLTELRDMEKEIE